MPLNCNFSLLIQHLQGKPHREGGLRSWITLDMSLLLGVQKRPLKINITNLFLSFRIEFYMQIFSCVQMYISSTKLQEKNTSF